MTGKVRASTGSSGRILKRFLLLVVSTCLVLLAGEAALRLSGYGFIWVPCSGFLVPSSQQGVGYEPLPFFSGFYAGAYVQTNELGLRDTQDPRTYRRPRILLLGDSVLFGFGVPNEQTLAAHLERLLRKKYGKPFEVLNAGVNGYHIAQEAAFGDRFVRLLNPDTVVFIVIPNDVDGRELYADAYGDLRDSGVPPPPNPCSPQTLFDKTTFFLKKHSQLFNAIRVSYIRWKVLRSPWDKRLATIYPPGFHYSDSDWNQWRDRVKRTVAVIDKWNLPTAFFVVSTDFPSREALAAVVRSLEETGYPVWNSESDLGIVNERTAPPEILSTRLWWDIHPDGRGQELIARSLFNHLCGEKIRVPMQ